MGCANAKLTDEERAAIKKSKEWDKSLTKKKIEHDRVIRVLLLGTGESGKSTILKQMRILYDKKGFTSIEKETFKVVVRRNIVESMQTLLEGVESFNIQMTNDQSLSAADYLNKIEAHDIDMWNNNPRIVECVQHLWTNETAIQESFQNRSKLQLLDSTPYLFANVVRIGEPLYVPIQNDILRARLRTTGIVEEPVDILGVSFKFLDVGGQRNERRKWIHCFSDMKAVIFVASLSEYDQVLYEDDEQDRLGEALQVFDDIVNNETFLDVSMILFLNKTDLFKEKLKIAPFQDYFKDFEGDTSDYEIPALHIQSKFVERCSMPNKDIFSHLTCATDTGNVKRVFEVCKLRILEDNLAGVGLR